MASGGTLWADMDDVVDRKHLPKYTARVKQNSAGAVENLHECGRLCHLCAEIRTVTVVRKSHVRQELFGAVIKLERTFSRSNTGN